jgi:hypothetical protein
MVLVLYFTVKYKFVVKINRNSTSITHKSYIPFQLYIIVIYINFYAYLNFDTNPKVLVFNFFLQNTNL